MSDDSKPSQDNGGMWLAIIFGVMVLIPVYGPAILFEVAVHGGGMSDVEAARMVDRLIVGPTYDPPPDGYEWRTCGTYRGVGPCLKKK